jgi:hypothetical protein
MMNEQTCDQYGEWMSLAQDGMLSNAQMRLLHVHLASCPPCQTQWEAMTFVSLVFRAAPLVAPAPGFVERAQAKLAYRTEKRRRSIIWLTLGIGTIALLALALPSVVGLLSLTGRLILPYQVVAYVQTILSWVGATTRALADAGWVLFRYTLTRPAVLACLGSATAAGVLAVFSMRYLFGKRLTQS